MKELFTNLATNAISTTGPEARCGLRWVNREMTCW